MDSSTNERPLMSFAILAYNQERFIREAVEGALAQTYSPLEIILSDDCSTDRTFETMQEMAAAYRGPHIIRTNRTPRNGGLCEHCSQVAGLARGQLIIGAAGDDTSLPYRTSLTFRAWEDSHRVATSLWGNSITVDEAGRACDSAEEPSCEPSAIFKHLPVDPVSFLSKRTPAVFGCSHAFAPKLFSIFGPLHPKNVMEDFQLGFRSILAGSMTFIDAPLVKYRRHGSNISAGQLAGVSLDAESFAAVERKRKRVLDQFLALFEALAADLEMAKLKSLISDEQYHQIKNALAQQVHLTRLRRACVGTSTTKAASLIWQFWRAGGGPRTTSGLLPRVLPLPAYRLAVILANRGRQFWKRAVR